MSRSTVGRKSHVAHTVRAITITRSAELRTDQPYVELARGLVKHMTIMSTTIGIQHTKGLSR